MKDARSKELVGFHLDNGGIIIRAKETTPRTGEADGFIILAFIDEKDEFATWFMRADDYACTTSGHYFLDLFDAVEDFKRRS